METNPPGDDWRPLSVELGGRTYEGFVRHVGPEVEVTAHGRSRRGAPGAWDHPQNLAERLLIDLHLSPQPAPPAPVDAPAPPPPRPPKAAAAPNNLVGAGLLAAFLALGALLAMAPPGRSPLTFAFVLVGWILAVMAHEFAHAGVAYLAGDKTVKAKGYLSFDPRRYGDLGTSLVIPLIALALGGIGFPGGAVYLRNDLMRSPAWRAAASLAGPGGTLVVLLLLAATLFVWSQLGEPGPLYAAVAMLAFLQATALILNLLPLPGLDGFNAIRPFLPKAWGPLIRRLDSVALLILLAAIFLVPGFSDALFGGAVTVAMALGVPGAAMQAGWDAFHFWR
jgi:Zn-dependent protease